MRSPPITAPPKWNQQRHRNIPPKQLYNKLLHHKCTLIVQLFPYPNFGVRKARSLIPEAVNEQ